MTNETSISLSQFFIKLNSLKIIKREFNILFNIRHIIVKLETKFSWIIKTSIMSVNSRIFEVFDFAKREKYGII